MIAANIPLVAYRRVALHVEIPIMGENYAGATLAMHVRNEPGDTGTPLIALANVTPPNQGLSVTYNASYPDPDGKLPNGASLVRVSISKATLEALPFPSDRSKPLELCYDIHITPPSETTFIYCGGAFLVYPGVTV